MKAILYPHGGSGNHGCEALVRSTVHILGERPVLFSTRPAQDTAYGLDSVAEILPQYNDVRRFSSAYMAAWFRQRVLCDAQAFDRPALSVFVTEALKADVALSIGGDNYCYGRPRHIMYMNQCIRERGIRNILWGASIEPEAMHGETLKDLCQYDHIIARESLTYNALLDAGITKTSLSPDPAFILPATDIEIPEGWLEGRMVGLNISPMVLKAAKQGMIMANYRTLIHDILTNTDMGIALIPHVVWHDNDDRIPLKQLFDEFGNSGRIIIIEDGNAMKLKGYISRCRFMVAARTHASIAAYSSCVPTLVVGYSIKSRGIATDLFGSHRGYVVNAGTIQSHSELSNAFMSIVRNEDMVRNRLEFMMPTYSQRVMEMKEIAQQICR